MTSPTPVPASVETELQKIETFLTKAGAIASTVVGGLAAAKHWLPTDVAAVFVAAGPFVVVAVRYEKTIVALLNKYL
jgi:hypothetical protein